MARRSYETLSPADMLFSSLAAARPLLRALGKRGTASALRSLVHERWRGEPFRGWPLPASPEEAASRRQIGDAMLLYRHLRNEHGVEEALRLLRPVVSAGAVAFLERRIGRIRKADLHTLSQETQRAFLEEKAAGFFNAEWHIGEVVPERFELVVTRCRFVEMCERAGCPKLAPLFCEGDLTFFGDAGQDVALERPETLSGGDERCLFRFTWKS